MPSAIIRSNMSGKEQTPRHEHEAESYYLAAQFINERPAGRAYKRAQETIFKASPRDLSVFLLMIPSRHI
jgi:hypothetical protein